ncbi:DUF5702 domain-containing protein [Wukongibacter sp. M2B1]|uniref:DUF5702 domain-containing protein n=1 Tax=Wukongibacter sp. M2B1 TaxID=3088895 RepID=UPI003D78F954
MRGRGQEGTITVFLSIILLIMITLAGVIVDAARINIAGPQVQRAVETSVRSSLAGYYKPLKEQYGLFALNENDEEKLKETIVEYIDKNLMINREYLDEDKIGKYLDVYDYEIESISVEPIFNLTENPVTRQQILEYMKYRAPKEFVENFIDKLDMFKKAGATSAVYERKVILDKELKKIENIQRDIYKKIYGEYETYQFLFWTFKKSKVDYFVRGLEKSKYANLVKEYVGEINHYKYLKEKLSDAADEDERKDIEDRMIDTIKDMRDKYNDLNSDINKYITVNKEARARIDDLVNNSKPVIDHLEEFKGELKEKKDDIMSEAYNQLSSEVESHKNLVELVKRGEDSDKINGFGKIIKELEDNKKKLDDVVSLVREINPSKAKRLAEMNLEQDKIDEIEDIKDDIIKKLEKYNNEIQYDYTIEDENEEEEYTEYDTRKESQEGANKRIKRNSIIDFFIAPDDIEDKDYEELPSTVKLKRNKDNKEYNLGFLWGADDAKEPNDNKSKGEGIKEVEFQKQESFGFGESALSYLGDITEKLDLENIRDEIYINEYIMGMFKNYLSEFDEEEKYNLRHQEKYSQVSFFERSEVEYILNGSRSEKINQTLMDSKILITRFALNSIHAFLCEEKNKIAAGTATVVAGVFTGGTGIPIIKTLILLGWSMAEATYDLDELKAGREVALYKTEEDWATDLKGGKQNSCNTRISEDEGVESSSQEKNPMNTSYQDYLRFFLLVQDDDLTMTRLQDLIQLNMRKSTGNEDLRLDELNTYVRVEAVVSIKYLFLTQSFIPKEFKTESNRHKFKVEIYQGY